MQEKIALLTDSMCDLPRDIIEKFKVKVSIGQGSISGSGVFRSNRHPT
jgi:fatty acid-binding protein DegV